MNRQLCCVALAALAFVPAGCQTKVEGGKPGTPDSFEVKIDKTLSVQAGAPKVQVPITITRHKDFHHDLGLKARPSDPNSKLKVKADPNPYAEGDKAQPYLTVEAPDGTDPGEQVVILEVTPLGSDKSEVPSRSDIKVKVTAKK